MSLRCEDDKINVRDEKTEMGDPIRRMGDHDKEIDRWNAFVDLCNVTTRGFVGNSSVICRKQAIDMTPSIIQFTASFRN